MTRPFHLALPTTDLKNTQAFYTDLLQCKLGRTSERWIDVDFFGHQLVFHDCGGQALPSYYNPVDAYQVPVPHFGVALLPEAFQQLATRLQGRVKFLIEPCVRFENTPGEQHTMFFKDPNDYALEFKSFANDRFIFEPFDA